MALSRSEKIDLLYSWLHRRGTDVITKEKLDACLPGRQLDEFFASESRTRSLLIRNIRHLDPTFEAGSLNVEELTEFLLDCKEGQRSLVGVG